MTMKTQVECIAVLLLGEYYLGIKYSSVLLFDLCSVLFIKIDTIPHICAKIIQVRFFKMTEICSRIKNTNVMKRIIKVSIMLFAFMIVFNGQLQAIVNPTFNYSENQMLVVELNDWQTKKLTLDILDHKGELLYSDKIEESKQSSKEYNLKDLTIGKYYIVLYGERKRTISGFSKGIDGLHVTQEIESDLFDPKIKVKRGKLNIDYKAYGEDVRVSIIGQKGIAFSALYENEYTIDEQIKITNLSNGSYVIVFDSRSETAMVSFKK
jgi:hypothetical protein